MFVVLIMGYSLRTRSINAADAWCDETNLLKFALKVAGNYHSANRSHGAFVDFVEIPFIFLGTLAVAPFRYKVDNQFCRGTSEWEERIRRMRISQRSEGLGVKVEYFD